MIMEQLKNSAFRLLLCNRAWKCIKRKVALKNYFDNIMLLGSADMKLAYIEQLCILT